MYLFEYVVGLEVRDNAVYEKYREKMFPLLLKYEGGFKYDFTINENLKTQAPHVINRLFIIYFSSERNADLFFGDESYLKVKNDYFNKSVKNTTIISSYKVHP